MLKTLLFTFLFLLIYSNSWSQRYSFLVYNAAQGLPQSQVNSIAQDKQGYLWVGTLGGLAKFNGKDFHSFSTDNGLLNNRVTFVRFIDNVLWVGHEGGISRMTKDKFKKWSFGQDDKTNNVTEIIKFNDRIIISSNGGGLYELVDEKLVRIPINGDGKFDLIDETKTHLEMHNEDDLRIRDMLVYNNELLIGTRGGLLRTSDLKLFRHIPSLELLSVSGIANQGNKLFVTTFKDGLFEYSISKGSLKKIEGIDTLLTLRSCFLDSKENLWIHTNNGIYLLKNGK